MKRSTFITILSLLIPLLGMSQTKAAYDDDIYSKPGDAKTKTVTQSQNIQQTKPKPTPKYKKGAKEIVYIERENPTGKVAHDTLYVVGPENENRESTIVNSSQDSVYVVGQVNDSIQNNQEQGYYLNGFNGTESDLEYAERIRRFHNPRYEINIADPRYNDIYFLNSNDWNVYIDGSYAYVTPTWTNPYWWNYNSSPYAYGGYGWNYYPWSYGSFYGGFGYGGFYDDYFGYGGYYGYPYYGYGGYWGSEYGYGGYGGFWGGDKRGKNHEDADQRLRTGISSREAGYGYSSSRSAASSREASNQYTVISGSNNVASSRNSNPAQSSVRNSLNPTTRTVSNGIGVTRNSFVPRSMTSGFNGTRYTTTTRSNIPVINTRPRTSYNLTNTNYSTRSVTNNANTSRSSSATQSTSRSSNSTYYSAPSSSTNSGSSRSSSPSYSSGSSSSSSSSSGGSYSGGGGGGSSRSSGGGGGRR